jgi:hypothetical protein
VLSVIKTWADRVHAAEGVKVRVMVQVEPWARLDPQLLVWVKSLAFTPATAMLVMLSVVCPT